MPDQYTISDIGKRIRASNPDTFKNFTDQQIGERALQRKPEIAKQVTITDYKAPTTVNPVVAKTGDPNYKPAVIPESPSPYQGLKNFGIGVASKVAGGANPLLGGALQTKTGQEAAKGTVQAGVESARPLVTPFAMAMNKDLNIPGLGTVKSSPTSLEAAKMAGEVALSGIGLGKVSKALDATAKARKALTLSGEELAGVDKTKIKYLTTKGLDMLKTEGGILKKKTYQMTEQVKKLSDEFKHVLTSSNPEKNLQNVEKELSVLQQESKKPLAEVGKIYNANKLTTGIRGAISNMSDTVFEAMSKQNKAAYAQKRIDDFLSYVKEGTLKGLDDGLEAFRREYAKGDQTLSKSADATYQAVKKYITSELPKEKALIYNKANQQQAKLFDIAEILKGKLKTSVGKYSTAGKILQGAGKAAIGAAIYQGAKTIPGLNRILP